MSTCIVQGQEGEIGNPNRKNFESPSALEESALD